MRGCLVDLPVQWKVACYVLVPLGIGLGTEFLFERFRRRRSRRIDQSEEDA